MKEEEPNLEVMHIHLSNGESFFETDPLSSSDSHSFKQREMTKEINSKHNALSGYETYAYGNTYMLTYPIFNKEKKYIGAIELGLNPNFILQAVKELKGFIGMIFVQEDNLKKDYTSKNLVVDGFVLQSDLTPELEAISKSLLK